MQRYQLSELPACWEFLLYDRKSYYVMHRSCNVLGKKFDGETVQLIHTGALDSLQVLEEFLNCLDSVMLE